MNQEIWIFIICQKHGYKYRKKVIDSAKKSTTDAIKTASNRAVQRTAEAAGDLIGNKIAEKIANVSKKSSNKLYSQNEDKLETPKERCIPPEKRQQIIN